MITTLCYLEKNNKYLMLHRTKKENDININKWLGGLLTVLNNPKMILNSVYLGLCISSTD